MHYIDEGEGDVILFVHGTPSWSFEYRNIIRGLSQRYRCIAIDHIGFGLSAKPADYNYNMAQHADNLERFIEHLQLRDFTMVLHDFGGPIGLQYAVNHPGNIRQLVLLNTWAWNTAEGINAYLLRSAFLSFLYRRYNFSARFVLPASFGQKKLAKHLHHQYCQPFGQPSERNGTVGFARSLALEGKWFDELWGSLNILSNIPALFIWGMKDKFITPAHLEKLSAVFNNPWVNEIPSAGHFPQEEEPFEVADLIEAFMDERAGNFTHTNSFHHHKK
jgi:haloalkane dehalogenase